MKENKWVRLLAYITGLVYQELLLQNEYLAAENRILRAHLPSPLRLSDPQRSTLAEIGRRLGRKALAQVACIAKPGHDPGLVPETHRTEVRWIQTPELSWAAAPLGPEPCARAACRFRPRCTHNPSLPRQILILQQQFLIDEPCDVSEQPHPFVFFHVDGP